MRGLKPPHYMPRNRSRSDGSRSAGALALAFVEYLRLNRNVSSHTVDAYAHDDKGQYAYKLTGDFTVTY